MKSNARKGCLVIEKGAVVAGRYRLLEQVGSGAMGVVWKAQDERLDRTVAIKRLVVRYALSEQQTEETRRRAMREARIAARLQHRNAIAMFDVAEHEGDPCLVMEFLPSRSLSAVLSERGSLPPKEVAEIGAQVAAALAVAHKAGIVHRDIKPGNILLADNGTVKITDFGISKALDDGTVTTQTGIAGTPAYLAPEVARGDDPSRASDVFSLGSTLYHAVEGHPPFGTNSNPLALLHAVASGNAPAPKKAGSLADTLSMLMRPNPKDRPTMEAAVQALSAPVTDTPAPAPPTPPRPVLIGLKPPAAAPTAATQALTTVPAPAPATPGLRASRRNLAIVALAAVVVVAAIVVAIVFRDNGEPGSAHGGTGGNPSSAHSQTTSPPPSSSSSSPAPTGNNPIPANGPIPYSDAGQLVINYYGSSLNPAQRWALLSPNAQQAFGDEASFQQYWQQYTDVSSQNARGVTPNGDGSVTVPVDITYTKGDGTIPKHKTLRVTRVNGKLVIDSDAR